MLTVIPGLRPSLAEWLGLRPGDGFPAKKSLFSRRFRFVISRGNPQVIARQALAARSPPLRGPASGGRKVSWEYLQ
jgi:hypothetical protein